MRVRCSRLEMLFKINVLKDFANLTVLEFLFNKVAFVLSSKIIEIFKNIIFNRTAPVAASGVFSRLTSASCFLLLA